jgi:transketolase
MNLQGSVVSWRKESTWIEPQWGQLKGLWIEPHASELENAMSSQPAALRASQIDPSLLAWPPLSSRDIDAFELLDSAYRTLCAMLYNYAPMSGHPGGSISSGRIVSMLLFETMDYDVTDSDRSDADVLSYAAGHKALGLYAMWALRTEILRLARPDLVPDERRQLRLEDLLGFRRNSTNDTPLFGFFGSRALDGHPTPAIPFVPLATGASGVGLAASLGLSLAAFDWFGDNAPFIHILEGEGGLTPGRVAEALAFAGTASLRNVIVHIDWNQSSIDSDRVTREGGSPGDYVQWDPAGLFLLHDWNVIPVSDGTDLQQIASAQRAARLNDNGQPTAIIYRTTKGWRYGIEGRASHGAGHKLCSPGFFDAIPLPTGDLPQCHVDPTLCQGGANASLVEECYWQALTGVRRWLELQTDMVETMAGRIAAARQRLDSAKRKPRPLAPSLDDAYILASKSSLPPELTLKPGQQTTLRGQLAKVIGYLNRFSGGAFLVSAADLLGSTSVSEAAPDFSKGFFHTDGNRDSRTLAVGGICEDAMAGVMSGVSSFGKHIGVASSYAAFMAPLGHIAARLHAIGNQARHERSEEKSRPMVLICAHAGLATGEDGPTHADPQPLQLLQENFPPGALITLTPWDAEEIWPLFTAALGRRPSVIAPFVTRPPQIVLDREALRLAPATDAVQGLYKLRSASGQIEGTIVLQESGVTYTFLTEVLPLLDAAGIELDVFYVASVELFDALKPEERSSIFPEWSAAQAMAITGFTLPTTYRWIRSDLGRSMTMHPFMHGRYPGSGPARAVMTEAGLDGESQFRRISEYVRALRDVAAPMATVAEWLKLHH